VEFKIAYFGHILNQAKLRMHVGVEAFKSDPRQKMPVVLTYIWREA